MSLIQFDHVSFKYDKKEPWVLQDASFEIPGGVTSLMGQNGTGKSTTLLLASGRIFPTQGQVLVQGKPTASLSEEEKNKLISLVYQNMEFENEEPLGELLDFVHGQGFLGTRPGFKEDVIRCFELSHLQNRKTQGLSKGEMQRAVMAFALLYGSQIVVMDEPVFALEDKQKEACLDFITQYAKDSQRSFIFSIHEMELTKKYAQNLLLFSKDKAPQSGPLDNLFTRETIEAAYQVPWALLYQKERLFRETLLSRPSPGEVWKQNQ